MRWKVPPPEHPLSELGDREPTPAELAIVVVDWVIHQGAEPESEMHRRTAWSCKVVSDWTHGGRPEVLWPFILRALEERLPDPAFSMLAAGPVEDLLAYRGDKYVDRIVELARKNPEFNRLLGGVWKNRTSDRVWSRICAIRNNSW